MSIYLQKSIKFINLNIKYLVFVLQLNMFQRIYKPLHSIVEMQIVVILKSNITPDNERNIVRDNNNEQ